MANGQNFQEIASHFEPDRDVPFQQKWKSTPVAASEDTNACFDCNICLDSAHDPVVTLCGHLYCWPCIYRWIHVQNSSPESEQQPQCPVCKANISKSSVVPIYGRGSSNSESEPKKPELGFVIPHRPASGTHTVITTAATTSTSHPNPPFYPDPFRSQFQSLHQQQYFPNPDGSFTSMTPSHLGGAAMASFFNPMMVMFGEMVFSRMFGGSPTSLYAYPYPNTYPHIENATPRMRRQEMQVRKSLNRVSIFLFCCVVICLLLF